MPYMPPGWLPCGVSTTARTYCEGSRTRSAWRRMKSVETIFSTVTTAPPRAAHVPDIFSFIGEAVVTLAAPVGDPAVQQRDVRDEGQHVGAPALGPERIVGRDQVPGPRVVLLHGRA